MPNLIFSTPIFLSVISFTANPNYILKARAILPVALSIGKTTKLLHVLSKAFFTSELTGNLYVYLYIIVCQMTHSFFNFDLNIIRPL